MEARRRPSTSRACPRARRMPRQRGTPASFRRRGRTRSGGARSGRARGHRAAAQRLRRGRRQRKDDGEPCAAAIARALRTDGATVELDELADDRESEAEALLRPPSLAKGFEDVGQEGGADTSSGVRDREPREPLYAPEADQDAPAVGRELEGIADEVLHHLLEACRVSEHL